MKRTVIRSLSAALILLWISGCIPYSDNPLTAPGVQEMDSSIYGTWFWKDDDDHGYVHIGMDNESKLLRIVMLEFDDSRQLDLAEFSAHTSSLGNNRYLNLKLRSDDNNSGFTFIKYAVSADSLDVSLVDADLIEKAIRDSLVKGTLSKDAMFSATHITDTSKNLQPFFLKYDKDIFKKKIRLYKLNPPEQAELPR